jgi:hypothetical protein
MSPATHPAAAAHPGAAEPGEFRAALRRWRGPGAVVALILLAGVVIAELRAGPPVTGPLDPNDTGPAGAHAVVALLRARGQNVIRASSVPAAARAARAPGTTVVVTGPGPGPYQPGEDLAALARLPASLLLVAPGKRVLALLAPGIQVAGAAPVRPRPPGCGLPGARAAGPADLGGVLVRPAGAGGWRCYPARPGRGGFAVLAGYRAGQHLVTVLGTGIPLSNAGLGRAGNAALALNLLAASRRIVWLAPSPLAATGPAGGRPRPLASLVPWPAYLVAAQLGIAVLVAAGWRARRFGPLVTEPLPVAVPACETVAGHGRLYHSRQARGRAAAALRSATLARVAARLGLPRGASPEAVATALASRAGADPAGVLAALTGPAPRDDAALVTLAAELERMEGQMLTP